MSEELKKLFGCNIEIEKIKDKPKLPLFLIMHSIYKIKINGVCFILVERSSDEKFGIKAFKKQIAQYEEAFRLPSAFLFNNMTRAQRDAMIRENISFIKLPEQIYLPFFGIILSNKIKMNKKTNVGKMMPVTQQLYLYMLYKGDTDIPKYLAAEELGCSRASISRASDQLIAMDLITQTKQGKSAFIKIWDSYKESLKKAEPYLIDPVQGIITIKKVELPDNYLSAGESALSEYTMLNPPPIPQVAVCKASVDESKLNPSDPRWTDPDEEWVNVELWKYDPIPISFEGKADPVSLACSLKETEDERVEKAIEEMMEKERKRLLKN